MTHRFQRLTHGTLLSILTAALLLLGLPGAASAEHEDRRRSDRYESRRGHDGHYRNDRRGSYKRQGRHKHQRHGKHSGHGYGHKVVVHGDYCPSRGGGHGYGHSYRAESYYCKPCGHRFHSRSAFHDHLHHHHRIPIWRLPFVIVHSTLGWIFHG